MQNPARRKRRTERDGQTKQFADCIYTDRKSLKDGVSLFINCQEMSEQALRGLRFFAGFTGSTSLPVVQCIKKANLFQVYEI